MDATLPECPGCVAAGKKIAELERENAQLVGQIAQLRARLKQMEEHLEALGRAAKRQAAPFSRGLPKAGPQRPGRKAGAAYRRTIPCHPLIHRPHRPHRPHHPQRCPNSGF